MIQVSNEFYVINSNPLQLVGDLLLGCEYCTREGHIVRVVKTPNDSDSVSVIDIDDEVEFDLIQRSELIPGESIVELTPKLLCLFWRLTRNNASSNLSYEED
jgi:hypothetical protein